MFDLVCIFIRLNTAIIRSYYVGATTIIITVVMFLLDSTSIIIPSIFLRRIVKSFFVIVCVKKKYLTYVTTRRVKTSWFSESQETRLFWQRMKTRQLAKIAKMQYVDRFCW